MTWAHAEPATGMIAANLPALRPLLEKALAYFSTLRSRLHTEEHAAALPDHKPDSCAGRGAVKSDIDKDKGNETRIMEGYAGHDVGSNLGDESQTDSIRPQQNNRAETQFKVRVRNKVDP